MVLRMTDKGNKETLPDEFIDKMIQQGMMVIGTDFASKGEVDEAFLEALRDYIRELESIADSIESELEEVEGLEEPDDCHVDDVEDDEDE